MKETKSSQIFLTIFLFSLLSAGLSATAQQGSKIATQTSPDTLVTNLYRQQKRRSPFFQTKSRALLDRYFEGSLSDLIWKDAIRSKGEVGLLDGDPLYNAQDMEIKNFAVHKPVFANGQAEVIVSFENFGKKEQIVFVLVPRRSGWRISNLRYSDGTTLVGILKGGSAENREHRSRTSVRSTKRLENLPFTHIPPCTRS